MQSLKKNAINLLFIFMLLLAATMIYGAGHNWKYNNHHSEVEEMSTSAGL